MKPDPTQARRMLHWFGSGLGVAGILFVLLKLAQYREQIDLARLGAEDWFVLLLLAIASGFSGLLLALGWRALLQHHGVTIAPAAAIRIYGISQIAKYVPSNVVHLIGRQALAVAENLPAWPVAKSAVWELGVLLCAAASREFRLREAIVLSIGLAVGAIAVFVYALRLPMAVWPW